MARKKSLGLRSQGEALREKGALPALKRDPSLGWVVSIRAAEGRRGMARV